MAELVGTLKVKFDTQTVSDKFKKREFVLTTDGFTPYPQQIPMQLTQNNCDLLDKFNEGDDLKVQVNFKGREWSGPQGVKFFLTLDCWRIEKVGGTTTNTPPPAATPTPQRKVEPRPDGAGNDNDDLPF